MGLQASGVMTLTQIQAEFGGPANTPLSGYYRGGGRVPNVAANNSIATSGALSFSQFYNGVRTYVVTASAANLNIRNHVIAQGWNGVGRVYVTINPGVVLYSTTYAAGLDIAGSFPAGIEILNYGLIAGRGGNGGAGGNATSGSEARGFDGTAGGPALYTSVPVTINNQGSILGGGGGGGGGRGAWVDARQFSTFADGGGGGGGGQDAAWASTGGAGGVGSGATERNSTGNAGAPGTGSAPGAGGISSSVGDGGAGGAWGQPGVSRGNAGANGGAAGACVINNYLISWAVVGAISGPVT